MFYTTAGKLRYSRTHLILDIDPEIAHYYYSLIPKYYYVNRPMYPAHICVVRKEIPPNIELWKSYKEWGLGSPKGRKINIIYSPEIHHNNTYWWLNAFSRELEEIRRELGLPLLPHYFSPPQVGISPHPTFLPKHTFHITIGNNKIK